MTAGDEIDDAIRDGTRTNQKRKEQQHTTHTQGDRPVGRLMKQNEANDVLKSSKNTDGKNLLSTILYTQIFITTITTATTNGDCDNECRVYVYSL